MKKIKLVLLILLCLAISQKLVSNDYLLDSTYAFNGTIKSIYTQKGINYIGGGFTKISYVTGFGSLVNKNTGIFANNFPKINGRVNVATPDGFGGYYIGGEFTKVGSEERLGLARIDAAGNITTFAPKVNVGNYPYVFDIVLYNNKLYISGSFEGINNISRKYIACLELNGNVTDWNPIVNDEVFALDVYNDVVYFGGNFTKVNNQDRYFGAAVSTSGSLLNWNPQANNNIRTVKVYDEKIYLGGNFTKIQGVVANRLVKMNIDGTLGNIFPNFNSVVETINFYENRIYVGGRFTKVNNLNRSYGAALDTNGLLLDWNPQANAKINVIKCDPSGVYLGGSFSKVLYNDRFSYALVTHSGNISGWNPDANSTGLALALSSNNIFVGGLFNGLGGFDRNHLVAIDTLGNIMDWNPSPNNDIYSVMGDGTNIYVSGAFSKISNINIDKFASLNPTTGELNNFRPVINGYVYSLIKYHDRIIIAGSFTKINNIARTNMAAFDNDGNLMSFAPQLNSSIYTMDNDGKYIYIGGYFTKVNGQDRNMIACIDTSGTLTSFDPDLDNAVLTLKYFKDKVYIGGWFATVGGVARSRFAAISKNGTLLPLAPNPNNAVWSILTFSQPFDVVYIGGDFNTIFNQNLKNLVAVDANGGLVPWYPNPDKSVLALSSSSSQVFAGGLFLSFDNTLSPNFARLNTYSINPGKPSLLSPADNSIKVPVLSRFDWTATEYTSSYRIQFTTISTFSSFVLDTIVPINYLELDSIILPYNTKVYWRVKSLNSSGQSPWSSVWSFTTRIAPPIAPELSDPINSEIDIAFGQLFEWNGSNTTSESYQLQYSDNAEFTNILFSDSALATSSRVIPDILMQPLKTYYWRVRGINESGPGAWSDIWSFTTAEFFTHSISLKTGWNLISSNILPNNDAMEKVFSNILDNVLIVKNYEGKVFIPQYNINTIGKWDIYSGYKVYCLSATTLNIIGYLINPSQSTYNLKQGWNQISYARSSPMNASTAFQELVDAGNILIVKDDSGKVFIPDYNINQIGNLVTGKAYQIFMKNASQFTYPPNN